MIKFYPSLDDMRDHADKLGAYLRPGLNNLSWFGGERVEDTQRLSRTGDVRLVPNAEKLIEGLELGIETSRKEWAPSPAGVFCCVPDLIAGRPTPMRRLIETEDERAPIEIYAVLACSAGIDSKTLEKRGAAILALVLALTRTRPVNLYLVDVGNGNNDGTNESVIVCRVNTAPLDLARACYALTSAGLVRRMMYGLTQSLNGWTGGWPATKLWSYTNPKPYFDDLTKRIASDPSRTLMIPGAQLGDELLTNPTEWVNTKVRWFTEREEEV